MRVVDARTEAVLPGARLALRDGERLLHAAVTSDSGTAAVTSAPLAAARLETSCDGYRKNVSEVELAETAALTVRLEPDEHWIAGSVADPAGRPLAGLTVCAWPRDPYPRMEELHPTSASTRPMLRTTTTEDGTFALRLDPRHEDWTLAAGGQGWVTPKTRTVGPARRQGVELRALALHGCVVQWRDLAGGPVRASPWVRQGTAPDGVLRDERGRRVDEEWAALGLLGFRGADLRRTGTHETVFLYANATGDNAESLGPLRLSKLVPGYESLETELTLPRIEGPLPTVPVALRREAEAWCALRVGFAAPCADERPRHGQIWPVTVSMTETRTQRTFRFALPALFPPEVAVGDLPAGIYETRWESLEGFYRSPVELADLRQGEFTLFLDASMLGCVECVVLDEELRAMSGLAVFRVERLDEQGEVRNTCTLSFRDAPYLCEGLPAGDVRVVALYPPTIVGRRTEVGRVRAGERVSLHLEPFESPLDPRAPTDR